MNARDLFKQMLSELIADEQGTGEYPLDLRAGKAPFSHKDNEVFLITELDECFDYVKDSKEWFVDIYANTIFGKIPHAEFTGSALTSPRFAEALEQNAPKTAEDKFYARLEELGIHEDWVAQGEMGRVGVETEEGVVIMVHEDDKDKYSEFTFPPMKVMAESDDFRMRALAEFYNEVDNDFLRKLVEWVVSPTFECPLDPVDVYFIWDKPVVTDFEDDDEPAEVIKHGRKWEVLESYKPSAGRDWWVSDFENVGTLYMNNQDGYMVLYDINGTILKSDI